MVVMTICHDVRLIINADPLLHPLSEEKKSVDTFREITLILSLKRFVFVKTFLFFFFVKVSYNDTIKIIYHDGNRTRFVEIAEDGIARRR